MRREREIEVAEQRRRADVAERDAAALRTTLSFGLGKAILDARTPGGLLRLPARIVALRRDQRAKRASAEAGVAAPPPELPTPVTLVAEARARALRDGVDAARRGLAIGAGRRAERARALAELAFDQVAADPDGAVTTGLSAATLAPAEPRLWALAAALWDGGSVAAPARLLALLRQPATAAYRHLAEDVTAAAEQLAGVPLAPLGDTAPGSATVVVTLRAAPFADDPLAWAAETSLAEALARGSEAVLLTPPGYPDPGAAGSTYTRPDGVRVVTLPPVPAGTSEVDAIAEALRRARGGVVRLIGEGSAFDTTVTRAARSAGGRLDTHVVALDHWLVGRPESERGRAAAATLVGICKISERVSAASPAIAERLAVLGIDATVTPTTPASVGQPSADLLATFREEFGIGIDDLAIACPVPLDSDPGLIDLLEPLASDPAGTLLLFTGSGPFRGALQRRAADLGLFDRVRFVGPLLPAEVVPTLALCAAAVLPRRDDAAIAADTSGAIGVAAALGLPLFASPAERHWIGGSGIAAHPLDPEHPYAAIARHLADATAPR